MSMSVQLILNVKMAQRVSIPLAHISAFVHEDIKGNIAIKVSILLLPTDQSFSDRLGGYLVYHIVYKGNITRISRR